MKNPHYPRPGPVLLCSGTVCALWAGIVSANSVMDTSQHVDTASGLRGESRLALAYNEPMPAWMQVPERSTVPVVRSFGLGLSNTAVRYRTLSNSDAVVAFYKARLDWKELEWTDFAPRRTAGQGVSVSIGYNALTGEQVRIDVRESGYLRGVEIVLSSTADPDDG